MTMRCSRVVWVCVLLAMALEGCALLKKKPPPPPAAPTGTVVAPVAGKRKATITIRTEKDVNPDRNSEPKPVTVRVYELPADAPLRNTTIDKVLDDDKAALSYLARYEYTLAPGREESRELALSDATSFIGIVALFRDAASASSQWRAVVPVPKKPLLVTVAGTRVSVASTE